MHMTHPRVKLSVFSTRFGLSCPAGLEVELFGNVSVTRKVQFTPFTLLRHGYFIHSGQATIVLVKAVIAYRSSEAKPVT